MKRLLVIPLVFLAGCSSPADVERLHAVNETKYHDDIVFAQEWNTHVLGIPSSGWLTILILSVLALLTLVILAGVWIYRVQERRARDRRLRDQGDFQLEQARVARGNCQVCGASAGSATSVSPNKD